MVLPSSSIHMKYTWIKDDTKPSKKGGCKDLEIWWHWALFSKSILLKHPKTTHDKYALRNELMLLMEWDSYGSITNVPYAKTPKIYIGYSQILLTQQGGGIAL